MFLSTFEKPLDAKRRLVVPMEFRASVSGPFDGVFCFPSIEADCIEGGGKALYDRYQAVIEELDVGDPLRYSLEFTVLGGMAQLSFDTAGRVTLPENLCQMFGLTDQAVIVGLGDRFQIWRPDAFHAERLRQRQSARDGLAALRAQQRQARMGGAA
ncbi:division/cell wall cluster transcriptional repressor MraZ [Phenylobacterium montanum]|uniref:Transcriptional regulator MraZ n=1 Tax=Phenylobacterium montanum TaxID=2823693 RepID=A0A975IUF0_9CAUL|nr:division/cell wall cluster transcriptional repressor MraZ [Caulobacter sp. S6]QUD87738.1 division/cell wall cluster transcriptional repressor MraZ [Caulobacter sp. S6]